MQTTTFEETKAYSDYNFVPVIREILADMITPIHVLRKIAGTDKNYYLLESVEPNGKWSRYSFLGYKPVCRLFAKDFTCYLEKDGEVSELGDATKELKKFINSYRSPRIKGAPTFTGGLVGYFSYEMIGYAERKLSLKENKVNDFDLMCFDSVIAYDHQLQKIMLIANFNPAEGEQGYDAAISKIEEMERMIFSADDSCDSRFALAEEDKNPEFTCNTTEEEYSEMVRKTIDYIHEGDIFQAVVSRKFSAPYRSSLLSAYRILRTTNPSPYMYFMNIDGMEITGASPETMVRVNDGVITTFPVAGTRPRGETEEIDNALEKELLADEKELAEHNMLVDLARNDVGRVAEYGSVYVAEYMTIHRFSKVMHIASTVKGKLSDKYEPYDAITALLPAGTLSGAPKFRACQIIDELEKEYRGVYGGGIGYIDFGGNLDVCITIRTAAHYDNKVYVQAGAGIVADSKPANEYMECANKAGAVIEAIKRAKEVQ